MRKTDKDESGLMELPGSIIMKACENRVCVRNWKYSRMGLRYVAGMNYKEPSSPGCVFGLITGARRSYAGGAAILYDGLQDYQ